MSSRPASGPSCGPDCRLLLLQSRICCQQHSVFGQEASGFQQALHDPKRRRQMKTRMTRLGAFAVFAVSLALFTGTALASNGHGNTSTPPGQAKKDQTPAAQGSTTAQVSTQTTAQASSSSSSNNNSANAPGQKKQAAAVAQASTATPGYKPSSTTSRWTTCSTGGGTGTTATCIGNAS